MAAGAIFATAAAIVWSRVHPEAQPQFVDLTAPPATERAPQQGAVRFAVAPVWAPERAFDTHYDLAHHVGVQIRRPVRVVQRRTYGEVNELLRNRGVDGAIICTGAYLEAMREGIALDVVAVPVNDEGPVYHSVFVARFDSPLRTVADLEGHSFGLNDPLSLSGNFYPLSVVYERGKDPRTFFTRTIYTYGDHGSLRAVLDGIVDAAAVNGLAYDFDGLRNDLRVIHRSAPLGISPVVVPRSGDPLFAAALTRALLTMHTKPEGRAILEALHLTRFEAPPPGLYDGAARIVDIVLQHRDGAP